MAGGRHDYRPRVVETGMKEIIDTTGNGIAPSGLTAEQLHALRLDQLRQQEAQAEQLRLSYLAARAAVEALRRELEGR